MTESEAPITVTLKAGSDFSAPWLVIRGYDPADVTAKLEGLDPVIEATLTAAGKFAASRSLGATTVATEPAQQAAPAQQPKQQGWGQKPAQQGGGQTSKYGGQLHPEGKTCEICPNVLELKNTQGGKAKWQCADWRWNQGNPNGHSSEWID